MKFLYSCLLLLAVVAASQAYTATWGRRNSTDLLLLREQELYKPVKNKAWNVVVNYPHAGSSNYNITAIYIYDNFRNNSGAIPSIVSGGVGYRYAKIQLIGKVNQGIDSTVEIWGRW